MKWFKYLFGMCDHQWVQVDKFSTTYKEEHASLPHTIKHTYIQECDKCGKIMHYIIEL